MVSRRDWVEQTKKKVDEWDQVVDELEDRISSVSEDSRAGYRAQLAAARQHLGEARTQLMRIQQTSRDTWTDLKEDVTATWDTTQNAMERSLDEVKKLS